MRVLFLGAFLCLLAFLFFSPKCKIRQIVIQSQDRDLAGEIDSLHLENDSPIFVPYGRIQSNALRADSSLKSIEFHYHYPGFLQLEVIPIWHEPVAFLEDRSPRGDKKVCLDEDGNLFMMKQVPRFLKEIHLEGETVLDPGKGLSPEMRDEAVRLSDVMRLTPWIQSSSINLDSGECTLYARLKDDGREKMKISAGSWQGLESRLKIVPPLLRAIREKGIPALSIDLRHESMPVITVSNL